MEAILVDSTFGYFTIITLHYHYHYCRYCHHLHLQFMFVWNTFPELLCFRLDLLKASRETSELLEAYIYSLDDLLSLKQECQSTEMVVLSY